MFAYARAMATETFRRCTACGAACEFSPEKQCLACPYCNATRAIIKNAGVPEHALAVADGARPALAAEGLKVARCTNCGAEAELAGATVATRCAFCTHPLEVKAATGAQVPAEGVVPFAVTKDAAVKAFRKWLGGLWFRPSDLKRLARLREMRGTYVPAWVFAAHAESRWTAEAGYHYYVDEVVEVNGRRETRRVQHTRWEHASGRRSGDYEDVVVSASRGLAAAELWSIDPFNISGGVARFDGDFLAGFEAEQLALRARETWPTAKGRIEQMEHTKCARAVPGDTHRNLQVDTHTSDERARSLLLPVYIAAYEYAAKVFRVLVNGQTGKVAGKAPWSVWKVALFVLTCLGVVGAIVWYVKTH